MLESDGYERPLQDNLLDGKDVRGVTKLSGRTIDRLSAKGLMPGPMKVGAQNRWSRRAIEEWMAAGCPAVRPGATSASLLGELAS